MDVGWQLKVIILFILVLLSAFFSGSEVALFSLDRKKTELDNSKLVDRYLINLLDAPKRLLVTVLVGNTIINVGASIIAVSIALDIIRNTGTSEELIFTIQIIAITFIIVIFGELMPKLLATRRPLLFSKIFAIPLFWINVLLFPVAETLNELIRAAASRFSYNKSKGVIQREELSELAKIGHERGTIIEKEHGLIDSIVSFRRVAVNEIMTPRVDMIAVPEDLDFDELLYIITSSGHSRIPVYKDDLDQVTGILYAKDILPVLKEPGGNFSIPSVIRKPMFIPATKMISSLLHEFQEKKMHIAIVVDEYGGTAGLITLEDIIEEIIGEIRDEYDKEENPVTKINDNSFLLLGKLPIEDLNELLGSEIKTDNDDFETVAGLILNHAGDIPKEGYSFQLDNVKFTVKEVLKKRIQRVLVEKIAGE